jgi:hypothetical protein
VPPGDQAPRNRQDRPHRTRRLPSSSRVLTPPSTSLAPPRLARIPNHANYLTYTRKRCSIGIDVGSHRTRICLWVNGSEIVVENKYHYSLDNSFYPGDFPSTLYVFDNFEDPSVGDLYSVEREYPERLSISAKYVFYALADASDTLLEQYPLVHHLIARKEDPKFKAHLRNAMVALLSALRDRALPICRSRKWSIANIGLTIPVQWTLEFEDVYRGLVSEVFDVNPDIIYFFTETEALARYLFKHQAAEMDPDEKHNAIMFIDFGGHNMVGLECFFTFFLGCWLLTCGWTERLRLWGGA